MEKPQVIIFDVNETLLDLDPLKERINSALKNEYAAEIWFAELLHYSLVETVKGTYNDFSKIAEAVLSMNAKKYNLHFTGSEIKEILSPISKLKPHEDVIPALSRLASQGIKLVAFSNGKPAVLKEQLRFAGIDHFFASILSVEGCQKYKPHPAAYGYVLQELNSSAADSMMVAAHRWDIAGAKNAGMKSVFIQRARKNPYPLAAEPDLILQKLTGLAEVFN